MISTLVNAVMNTAEKIKGIKFFRYEGEDYINQQNNNATWQVWFEDDMYTDYLVTRDILKITFNIDILHNVYQGDSNLDVHNEAFKIGIVLLKMLDKTLENISVYDYSFLNLSHFSDDDLFGVRMTISLFAPSPINECNIDEYIDEMNEYEKTEDKEITINAREINIDQLNLNPIKLNKNIYPNGCFPSKIK